MSFKPGSSFGPYKHRCQSDLRYRCRAIVRVQLYTSCTGVPAGELRRNLVVLPKAICDDVIGMASLVRTAYRQGDLGSIWNQLLSRVAADPSDAGALMDMSVILQTTGHRDKGLELQRAALREQRCYRRVHGRGTGLNILVFVAEGDFMANTPFDFLFEGSDANIFMYYIDAHTPHLRDLPPHDAAFIAVGEFDANVPVLENLQRLLKDLRGAIVNGSPRRILALTRDTVAAMFAGDAHILAPSTVIAERQALQDLASGHTSVAALLPDGAFPLVVRPYGTHGGEGLEKIDKPGALADYLERHPGQKFYLAPFIDYSGPDGLFRKQRIVMIDGKPYAGHWATSSHWVVHYLSAGMLENELWRAEEAAWMAGFDTDFAVRHARAFELLYWRIGLDYFVIDCAETKDGRLLLFEAHVAMIVHDMDPVETFPYKQPAMRKLFNAFQAVFQRRCRPALESTAAACG